MFCFRPFTCLTTMQGASEAMSHTCQQATKAKFFSQAQAAQLRTPPKMTQSILEEFWTCQLLSDKCLQLIGDNSLRKKYSQDYLNSNPTSSSVLQVLMLTNWMPSTTKVIQESMSLIINGWPRTCKKLLINLVKEELSASLKAATTLSSVRFHPLPRVLLLTSELLQTHIVVRCSWRTKPFLTMLANKLKTGSNSRREKLSFMAKLSSLTSHHEC
jgi:hypothetical protein